MTSNANEADLLAAVLAAPQDQQARLVYADWLEERGDPRADYLRLELELQSLPKMDTQYRKTQKQLRKLMQDVDRKWRLQVTQSKILACDVPHARDGLFSFECPRSWDGLRPTEDENVRYCEGCKQHVHFCSSMQEAKALGTLGVCVALDVCTKLSPDRPADQDTLQLPNVRMGRVLPPRLNREASERVKKFPSRVVMIRREDRKRE